MTINQAIKIANQIHKQNKTIVLTGGCFDILHIGHIDLLRKAKQQGDFLMVFLESDEKIKKLKGKDRPIFTQKARAEVLASLRFVDYVIKLPDINDNAFYDDLILKIKPDVISATRDDPNLYHINRQAKMISAKIALVNSKIKNVSSSSIISKLNDL